MIKLISLTTVSFTDFLISAKQATGRPLTSKVDSNKWDINSVPAYISCLKEFCKANPDLTVWDSTLQHVSLSVFVQMELKESLYSLLAENPFRILLADNETTAILTGNLQDWLWFLVLHPGDFSEQIYNFLIFGGFTPFFKNCRVTQPFTLRPYGS